MDEIAALVRIVGVRVLSRYIVELDFQDGTTRVIDLEAHLWGDMFEPLVADYSMFLSVTVDPEAATIVWPNGADLSPRMLYQQAKVATPA